MEVPRGWGLYRPDTLVVPCLDMEADEMSANEAKKTNATVPYAHHTGLIYMTAQIFVDKQS